MRSILRRALPAALITVALLGAATSPSEAAPLQTTSITVTAASTSFHLAKPKIIGQRVVGGILIAKIAKPKGAKLHYQWRSNGHAVKHATHTYFRVRRSDKGHRISVTVTATKRHAHSIKRTSTSVRIGAPRTSAPPSTKPPVSSPPAVSSPVSYTSIGAPIGREPMIDTHAGTVYSLQDGVTSDGHPTIALTAVDAATSDVERSTNLFTFWDEDSITLWDRDVRVDNQAHVVWVLAGGWYGSYVLAIDGRTMSVEDVWYTSGDVGTLAVDPSSGKAYYASAHSCVGDTDDDYVVGLDATNGSSTSVRLPTDTGCDTAAPNVAFDSANHGVYVAFDGQLFAYSRGLSLASTLTLPLSEQGYSLGVTADGDRHVIYVTGTQLYEVAGSTNTISRTASVSSTGRVPVIDPTIHTLYIGNGVYDTDSLGRTGTLPVAADSVDGGSHTIYGKGTIVSRHGG